MIRNTGYVEFVSHCDDSKPVKQVLEEFIEMYKDSFPGLVSVIDITISLHINVVNNQES